MPRSKLGSEKSDILCCRTGFELTFLRLGASDPSKSKHLVIALVIWAYLSQSYISALPNGYLIFVSE